MYVRTMHDDICHNNIMHHQNYAATWVVVKCGGAWRWGVNIIASGLLTLLGVRTNFIPASMQLLSLKQLCKELQIQAKVSAHTVAINNLA